MTQATLAYFYGDDAWGLERAADAAFERFASPV